MDEFETPLLQRTVVSWAELAAANLGALLADHAICEQQAAQTALALIGQYPDDAELVEKMAALAAEEVGHFRRVIGLLHRRGERLGRRRPNPWVRALKAGVDVDGEPFLKCDRLLVCALVEARSAERFELLHSHLLEVESAAEVVALLADLGPAESRHWRLFHHLAGREVTAAWLEERWARWLEWERDASAGLGVEARVHG